MKSVTFDERQTLHFSIRSLIYVWKMVMAVSTFRVALLLLDLDACHHWWNYEFQIVPANSTGKGQGICQWVSLQLEVQEKVVICKMIQNPHVPNTQLKNVQREKKVIVLEWLSPRSDNPIEMLWKDLKQVLHAKKLTNITELKLLGKEEGINIPPSWSTGNIYLW